MKATHLLETQHRQVKALFQRLEQRSPDERSALEELANSLAAHLTVEQDVLLSRREPGGGSSSWTKATRSMRWRRSRSSAAHDSSGGGHLPGAPAALRDVIEHACERGSG